jgi:cytochrome c peroxidase
MKLAKYLIYISIAFFWLTPAFGGDLSDVEQLGKSIFFDENLSLNSDQSCASCHDPSVGWTGPTPEINATGGVYEGSNPGFFGNRKPPSSAYATQSPIFSYHKQGGGLFIGGNFWDGRATGEKLGNPAADQAQGPFLNPAEQALPDNACVVYLVCNASYPVSFEVVWGDDACGDITWPAHDEVMDECELGKVEVELSLEDSGWVDTAYDQIALSIAAYEASSEVNAFTSKFDAYQDGRVSFSNEEKQGMKLFNGKAKCSKCHPSKSKKGQLALFTDYSFDNLGVPRNPDNPFYEQPANSDGFDWVDEGLGVFLMSRPEYAGKAEDHEGAQKVPTLRNVDLRPDENFIKAYSHNGYFKTLKGIVHFYNTRDVKPTCPKPFTSEAEAMAMVPSCWPEPEVDENVNDSELGDLKLTDEQEDAIVAFLKTLSDGFEVP